MINHLNNTYSLRLPPKEVMDGYLNDTKYLYDRAPQRPESFFSELVNAFLNFIDWLLSSTIFGKDGNYYQIAALILIAFGVFYILKEKLYLFTSKTDFSQSEAGEVSLVLDDVSLTDLDKLEAMYMSEGNNRGVVRVLYIKFLRKLGERKLLSLDGKKTNWEYASELRGSQLHAVFIDVTLLFENSWYGGFEVNSNDLNHFRKMVNTGEVS